MRATGQTPQHAACIVRIRRLAEHIVIQYHFGIGAEYPRARRLMLFALRQPGESFIARDPADVIFRRLVRLAPFHHLNIEHGKMHADLGEQFATTRRLRGGDTA